MTKNMMKTRVYTVTGSAGTMTFLSKSDADDYAKTIEDKTGVTCPVTTVNVY